MPLRAAKRGDLEAKMKEGTFVGVLENSEEYVIMTSTGAVKARTIRRQIPERRWNKEAILKMKGTAWAPRDGEKEEPVPAAVRSEERPMGTEETSKPEVVERRRVMLEKTDFDLHGYSERCTGCANMQRGRHPGGHS